MVELQTPYSDLVTEQQLESIQTDVHWWLWPASTLYFALYPELGLPLAKLTNRAAVWHGDRSVPLVSLTFDDGPDPVYTPLVLDLLAREDVRATFFVVGERARRYPDLVYRIREEGHEIGNHGDSWTFSRLLSDEAFEQELLRAGETLRIGEDRRMFRPAGGLMRRSQSAIVRRHGYETILASGLPFDPFGPPAGWISALTARTMDPGAIVALHDAGGDRTQTVKALPRIIAAARRRHLEFVPVGELPRG